MNLLSELISSMKKEPETVKPEILPLTVYITSLEEWEDYYINMYEFVAILKKDNPKSDQLWKLFEIGKTYKIDCIQSNGTYIIIDAINIKPRSGDAVITNVTTDLSGVTVITSPSFNNQIFLDRASNRAYCGLYNKLKLNTPLHIITTEQYGLIGIIDVKDKILQISVAGVINISVEFDNLTDYMEVVCSMSNNIGRFVFLKDSFIFETGQSYKIKYTKMLEGDLYQILQVETGM
jgi:hypothetical protein